MAVDWPKLHVVARKKFSMWIHIIKFVFDDSLYINIENVRL